ncbi:hypothetical protein HYW46_05710 [Candidatus Daviesbacteria bacterium]|nr:hypothetical protein [Candidatus Daviesbacteria bacterium]
MTRKISSFIFLCLLVLIFVNPQPIKAESIKQITIVNPIRGNDFWGYKHQFLDTPKKQYELIEKNNLPATWLVRYDALKNEETDTFLKSLNNKQEIGLFLEVTPTLAKDAGVKYNQSENWHYAKSVFLIGYSPEDRKKLIDRAVKSYREIFSTNPKSVGAWWIDAYSLNYLHDKYGVEANLDVADQYSTDQYQVWGQYFSTPFYPAKVNALMPASSKEQKIGVVTIQWATRDPFNSYGNGADESTYSVQANDYLIHKLGTGYFEKLINIYPQTTVGLENDFSWDKYGEEYQKQIEILVKQQKMGLLQVKTMSEFSKYYKNIYPNISPDVLIQADDPLGGGWKVVWFFTPKYRVGWFYGPYGSAIRDLRQFSDSVEESCFKTSCDQLNLAFTQNQAIDDVNFSTRWLIDEGKISNVRVESIGNSVQISYQNQAGTIRKIKFLPNDIEVDGKIQTISVAILASVQDTEGETKIKENIETRFDLGKNLPSIFVSLIKFLLLTVLFFLIPGWILGRNLLLSIPIGWSVFTLAAFFAGSLHDDRVLWIIPILSLPALYKWGLPKIPKRNITKENLIVMAVCGLGSISWLLTSVKNGLEYSFGLGFWGPNGHDGIWHLSLISELQKNFPPQNPVFAGERLNNYHYFFDLLLAKSANLLSIDPQELLFRLFPLFVSILAGLLMFHTTKKLFKHLNEKLVFKTAILATLFLYFGGSFGWVVSFFKNGGFGGESIFWAQQAISTLLNPPFAISIVIFLAGLYLFTELKEQKNHPLFLIISLTLLWGSLIEFKAYAGILVLGGLGFLTVESVIFKKDFYLLKIFIPILVLSLIVFLPNNLGSSSLLVISPFWLVQSMIDFQDRLGWERFSLILHSEVFYKIVAGNLIGLVIFLTGNLGTRIIGFASFKEIFNQKLLFYMAVLGLILPLIFVQKGNNWNIIQFFYYTIFILNFYAAITIVKIWRRLGSKKGGILVVLIVFLTIPTSINALDQYLPPRPPARLSAAEKEALDFLKNEPEGIVLTLPYDDKLRKKYSEPVPLAAYTSTAYVAAFSNHSTFLEDTINLEILGVDYKGRLNLERDFINIKEQDKEILRQNNISYVYVLKAQNFNEDEGVMGIKKIFENEEVKLFKVIK